MGIVNVTPDSFSDGGSHLRWERALQHALALVAQGADLLDVGGESTRPGSEPVTEQEELRRVVPVLRALTGETTVPVTIDTRKPSVADEALSLGARWVNDVGGLREPAMAEVVARHGAGICLMHMRGEPATMQQNPGYEDVLTEVKSFLADQAAAARAAGLGPGSVWIDPGIGFGKRLEHNLTLMAGLDRLVSLGYPVVVGASRKGFIGEISGDPVTERLGGSLAAAGQALRLPRAIVRVHDVAATRQYLQVRRHLMEARADLLRDRPTSITR
jgi:dihydropteroate synthase